MTRVLSTSAALAGLAVLLLAAPAFGDINKSVKVEAGETSDGATSVNGSITVGAGATVTGDVSTVNGKIRIGEGAAVADAGTVNGGLRVASKASSRDLSTVNGSIEVAENVTVDGEITAVNGRIEVGGGSKVARDVGNVNGEIELSGSEIGGDLSTVNGDIELWDGAVVEGDIVVEKPHGFGWNRSNRKPRIVIGPGSRVGGVIRLEREVELYISESAEVGGVEGEMSMDDAVRFSGARP